MLRACCFVLCALCWVWVLGAWCCVLDAGCWVLGVGPPRAARIGPVAIGGPGRDGKRCQGVANRRRAGGTPGSPKRIISFIFHFNYKRNNFYFSQLQKQPLLPRPPTTSPPTTYLSPDHLPPLPRPPPRLFLLKNAAFHKTSDGFFSTKNCARGTHPAKKPRECGPFVCLHPINFVMLK